MTLSRTSHETRQAVDNMKTQLETGLLYLAAAKSRLQQIERDVGIKVREVLTKLKNGVLDRISNGLADDSRSNIPIGWSNLRRDFLALTHHVESDRSQAEALIKELHEELVGQIQSELNIAWPIVQDLAHDRHFESVFGVNQDLDLLSKHLESIVIKDLNIQIEPAKIQFKPVEPDRFNSGLPELIDSAIKEQSIDRSYFSKWIFGSHYSVYFFDGGAIREFYDDIVRQISDETMEYVETTVKRHVAGQIATAEEKLKICEEMFAHGLRSAIESRGSQLESNTASMHRVIEDLESMKKLKASAVTLRRRIEAGLCFEVASSDPPDLQIKVTDEADGHAQDTGRYVPPRSRTHHENARLTPKEGFTFSELESMVSPSHRDNWRMHRSGSGSWAQSNTPHRHRQQPTQSPSGENFSPRSNFFRNFQQTPRRGRGQEAPNRSGSWTG